MNFSVHRLIASLFAILLSVTYSSPAWAGGGLSNEELKSKITALVEESKLTSPANEAYAQEVKALRGDVESGKPLKDKSQALKLLALVRRHPERSAAERNALLLVSQAYWDRGEVSEEVGKIAMNVSGSNVVATYDAFRALIVSAKPLGFTARERADVAQLLYNRIVKDVDRSSTLFQVFVYGDLLNQLEEAGVVEVSDAIFVELLRWNEKKEEARSQVRKISRINSKTTIGLELELTAPLGETLAGLARRLARVR